MKCYYQQSSKFSATPAQIEYLRGIHKGYAVKTNGATRARCFQYLVFGDKVSVKREIVTQFKLEAQ